MNPKAKRQRLALIAAIAAGAVIAVLGVYALVCARNVAMFRRAAHYSASSALEETVNAAENMRTALEKAEYATDGEMRAILTADAYAAALSCESALSALPFATQELERISGYLNDTAAYCRALSAASTAEGAEDTERDNLRALASLSRSLSDSLKELQANYHNGEVTMDTKELRLQNLGTANEAARRVSGELLRYESEFPQYTALKIGQGGQAGESDTVPAAYLGKERLSDAEKLAVAAAFAGVSPAEVRLAYSYEGADGLKAYTAGDALITVGAQGVISMGRSRLVSEETLTLAAAQKLAYEFLDKRGYGDMTLLDAESANGFAHMRFISSQDGALFVDNAVTLSLALDDGAVCAFNASAYSPDEVSAAWELSESDAVALAPGNVTVENAERVIIRAESGESIGAYKLTCRDRDREIALYYNAVSGKQERIELQELSSADA